MLLYSIFARAFFHCCCYTPCLLEMAFDINHMYQSHYHYCFVFAGVMLLPLFAAATVVVHALSVLFFITQLTTNYS